MKTRSPNRARQHQEKRQDSTPVSHPSAVSPLLLYSLPTAGRITSFLKSSPPFLPYFLPKAGKLTSLLGGASLLSLILSLSLWHPLHAQEPPPNTTSEKGITPIDNNQQPIDHPTTRAVVIGISDYLEPEIPDLQYAHRDAQAFARWLQSPAGGSVPVENIQLYTNEEATAAQIVVSIQWLIEQSASGDRAIIYLSGHGDVERITKYNHGYFLGYDSPHRVYSIGAFSMRDLRDMVATMSEAGVETYVISDACRSGKLAGSEIGGAQATALQLKNAFDHEVLLLSCQPEEYSIEGEQWGGGRGLFSYHLENGLYGLADGNEDRVIELREVRNYLEEKVPMEAEPEQQMPLVSGPVRSQVAQVDPPTLAEWRSRLETQPLVFKETGDRALEQFPDSVLYQKFLAAIEEGRLLEPEGESADDYYEQIIANPDWARFHGKIKRKFVVALADEAQVVVNKLLRTDPAILDGALGWTEAYQNTPDYLTKATDIPGQEHYLYPYLKAKEYFFKSKQFTSENYPEWERDSLMAHRLRVLDSGLIFDADAPYLHLDKGWVNSYYTVDLDSAFNHFERAYQAAPQWTLANYFYGWIYGYVREDTKKAEQYLLRAIQYDSTFLPAYERLGYFSPGGRTWAKEYVKHFTAWKEQYPGETPVDYRIAMGLSLSELDRYKEAKEYFLTLNDINLKDYLAGVVYPGLGEYGKAIEHGKKALKNPGGKFLKSWGLCIAYGCDHRYKAAQSIAQQALESVDGENLKKLGGGKREYIFYGADQRAEDTYLGLLQQSREKKGDKALAGMAGSYGTLNNLGFINAIQGEWKEAEKWFLLRDSFGGDRFVYPWNWRAWLAFGRGEEARARALLDSHLRTNKENITRGEMVFLISYLISAYELDDYCIFWLETALPHFPDYAHYPYHLGRLYIERKGNLKKGMNYLRQTLRIDPEYAYAYYHLGRCYAVQGRKKPALRHLKLALQHGYCDFEQLAGEKRWEVLSGEEGFKAIIQQFGK